MNPGLTGAIFIVFGIVLVIAATSNLFKADRHRQRREPHRPVSDKRYRNLWVIDREDHDDRDH